MKPYKKNGLKNSIYDGMFANMFATLTGGVFLTGFALYLGMNELMIGFLASMPFIGTIFQIPASHLSGKKGRKKTAYWAAALARTSWIFVLIAILLPIPSASIRSLFVLGLIFISYAFTSVSYISWLSWISDIVPENIRGRFFGNRNMLCGAAGMTVLILFGKLLDGLNSQSFGRLPLGFGITFISAVFFGILSLYFLKKVPEPLAERIQVPSSFRKNITRPFKEPNFRKFLIFVFLWSFSVYFASPFLTLYFLRDLKFGYGFIATLGILSGFADMIGMHFWGKFSDKVRNKAIIHFAGWIAVFLPLVWVTVRPESIIVPILLHIVGGGFWAGINLCMNNLLLRISPREDKTWFLSMYNVIGGLGATMGPISAGLLAGAISRLDLQFFSWNLIPLQVIFLISTLLRLLSLQFIKNIHEPEESTVSQMIRILRSVRGLNMAAGFNYLLHPFIEIEKRRR